MDTRIKTEISSEILAAADLATFINYDESQATEVILIDQMITAVRTYLERRMSASFASRVYEIFFKSYEAPFILPVFPIISIDEVNTVDQEGTEVELVLNSGYFSKGTYEVEILPVFGSIQNPFVEGGGYLNLKVECTAGYGNAVTQILPLDITMAIKSQVFQWYDNRDDFMEGKYLGMIDKIVNNYRRIW